MDKTPDNPLIAACRTGNLQAAGAALAAGTDVNAGGGFALLTAAAYGYRDLVALLLAAQADVHAEENLALRWAADEGHREVVEALLDAGADVRACADYALRSAAKYGHSAVVAILLDHAVAWPEELLATVEAGPCGVEVEAWRARRSLAEAAASIIEMAAP